jgi:hypothetical protein
MATIHELEAEAKRVKDELAKARKAANAPANARKRAAKSLDRWTTKNVARLSREEVGLLASVVALLDPSRPKESA